MMMMSIVRVLVVVYVVVYVVVVVQHNYVEHNDVATVHVKKSKK